MPMVAPVPPHSNFGYVALIPPSTCTNVMIESPHNPLYMSNNSNVNRPVYNDNSSQSSLYSHTNNNMAFGDHMNFSSMLNNTNLNHNSTYNFTQPTVTNTYTNSTDLMNNSVSSSCSAVSALLSFGDCGECVLKESRYNQLKSYSDRLETDVSYWKNEATRLQTELGK
jgi:hypothetical protein